MLADQFYKIKMDWNSFSWEVKAVLQSKYDITFRESIDLRVSPKPSNTTKACKAPKYMYLLDPRDRKMCVYNNQGHNPISAADITDIVVLLWHYLCYNNVSGKNQ